MLSLSEAIALVPGWADAADLRAVPLPSGFTNRAWKIEAGGERFVLRLPQHPVPAPIGDPQRELQILRQVGSAGIGPVAHFAAPGQGLLVTRFVAGASLGSERALRDGHLEAMGATLRRLHALPPAGAGYTLAAAVAAWLALATAPARELRDPRDLAQHALKLLSELEPVAPRLCHNDPLPENFIAGDALRLIDWEYAGDGDPLFDLAALAAHLELGDAGIERLAVAHGSARKTDIERIRALVDVYHCLHWLWLAARPRDTLDRAAAMRALEARLFRS